MINKFNKKFLELITVKNYKFNIISSKLIKFIFFIRYLIIIFLLAFALHFVIPKFFNYEDKVKILNQILYKKYGLNIKNYASVEYRIFPTPRLHLKKIVSNNFKEKLKFNSQDVYIIISPYKLYNIKTLKIKKLIFSGALINLDISNSKNFLNFLNNKKHKAIFEKSTINIYNKTDFITKIYNISFLKENKVEGTLLGNNFILKLDKNKKNNLFHLKIPNIGSVFSMKILNEKEQNKYSGLLKAKILNNNIIFNFILKDSLKIFNSSFNNRDLQFSFDSTIKFNPFFETDIYLNLKKIDLKKINNLIFFDGINLDNNLYKKINGKIKIFYKEKKLVKSFIKKLNLEIKSANGEFTVSSGKINVNGAEVFIDFNTTTFENTKRLNFKVKFNFFDLKKFLKEFKVKSNDDSIKSLLLKGSVNLSANKISFDEILIDNELQVLNEDKNYYKEVFEKKVLNENLLNIFDKEKLKEFIIETYQ